MSKFQINSKLFVCKAINIIDIIQLVNYKNILFLTSKTISTFPEIIYLTNELQKTNSLIVYNNIRPDAPVDTIDLIQDHIQKPDLIIAVGGGSVIDSAKALSIGWNNTTIKSYLYNQSKLPIEKIPLFVLPTTAGTGSELSFGAIIYDPINMYKSSIKSPLLQPDLVIIDVALYLHAPKKLISEVGFDALSHAIETYISIQSNPITRYQSVNAINIIFDNIVNAVNGDSESMEKIAIASSLMGLNLAFSSTCLPHRIQYIIGPMTKSSHAQGLIALYNGWLPMVKETDEFYHLSLDLGYSIEELIQKISSLKNDLNINYRLKDYGLTNTHISSIAEQVTGNLTFDPLYKNIETIKKIIKDSL
jgi:alcohol dehydrogenase class IV